MGHYFLDTQYNESWSCYLAYISFFINVHHNFRKLITPFELNFRNKNTVKKFHVTQCQKTGIANNYYVNMLSFRAWILTLIISGSGGGVPYFAMRRKKKKRVLCSYHNTALIKAKYLLFDAALVRSKHKVSIKNG